MSDHPVPQDRPEPAPASASAPLPDGSLSGPPPSPEPPPAVPPPAIPAEPGGTLIARGLVVAAGVLAGIAAWLVGEAAHGAFEPELTYEASMRNTMIGQVHDSWVYASMVAYGALGGLVGLLFGLAGGVGRRSGASAVLGGLVGLVVGVGVAILMAWVLVPVFTKNYDPDTEDLLMPMAIHAGLWIAAGLGGGLGYGLGSGGGSRRIGQAVVGGLVGALIGTALYEVVGAVAFPLEATVEPVSRGWGSRLAGRMLVAVGAAVGVAATIDARPIRTEPPKAPLA